MSKRDNDRARLAARRASRARGGKPAPELEGVEFQEVAIHTDGNGAPGTSIEEVTPAPEPETPAAEPETPAAEAEPEVPSEPEAPAKPEVDVDKIRTHADADAAAELLGIEVTGKVDEKKAAISEALASA